MSTWVRLWTGDWPRGGPASVHMCTLPVTPEGVNPSREGTRPHANLLTVQTDSPSTWGATWGFKESILVLRSLSAPLMRQATSETSWTWIQRRGQQEQSERARRTTRIIPRGPEASVHFDHVSHNDSSYDTTQNEVREATNETMSSPCCLVRV